MKQTVLMTSAYALLSSLSVMPALAQDATGEAQNPQEERRTLETVTITATKRAESLQDVPISVIATTGKEIEELAITKAEDLTANLPAINIAQNPIGNFVYIRGIGTPGANQGIEQSVSMFHDGIYMGRHQLTRAPFMDLERVEVLRGPQSIFFGKNTIGGAVHVISAKPTDTFEASLSGLYGSHGETELLGVISGPLSDRLRGRLAVRQYEMDGYLKNVMTKDDGPAREDTTIRAQLEFDATDNLTIRGKFETSDFKQTQQSTQLGVTNPFTAGAAGVSGLNQALVAAATGGTGVESYDDERAVVNDGGALLAQVAPVFAGLPGFPDLAESSDNSMDVGTLTIDWDLGGQTLTAITGVAQYEYRDICDCDFAALPLIQVDATEDYEQFSQELRLVSDPGEHFDYIVGAYYHDSDLTFRSIESFGSALAFQQVGVPTPLLVPNLTRDYVFKQKQDQWAIFGSGTWHLTDTTRAIIGLRYYEENKTADHTLNKRFTGGWDYSALVSAPAGTIAFGDTAADYDAFLAGFGTTDLGGGVTPGFITEAVYAGLLGTFEHDIRGRKRSENNFDWSLTAEHDFSGDIMGYASVATGTKGGGFDARFLRTNNNPFFEYEEESATSYEVGLKSTLFDGTMTFNAAAFYAEVEDFQVSIFDGATAFFVDNAAKVESKGIEIDMKWAATDHLTIGAASSFLDAKYADFQDAPCWAGTDTNNRGDCIDRGLASAHRDASGETVNFAPEFSANLNFDYRRPVTTSLEGRAVLNLNYSDGYSIAADLDPIYGYQRSYTKVDLRLSVGDLDDRWEVAIIGKNLTDELTSSNNNDQPLVPGNGFFQTDRPRSVAIQAKVNF